MSEGRIHYRTRLQLYPVKNKGGALEEAQNIALGWTRNKINLSPMMEKLGFFAGATFGSPERYFLKTLRHSGDKASNHEIWGMCLIHPCAGALGRSWRTDLVIESHADFLDLSLRIAYLQTRGYVGPSPPEPDPTVPALIKLFARSFELKDAGVAMPVKPFELQAGDMPMLKNLLFSPERNCPAVVMLPDYKGSYLIDPERVQSVLSGGAHLFAFSKQGDLGAFTDEMCYLLPYSMRLVRGAIRIYQPIRRISEKTKWEAEGRRHRFFNGNETKDLSPVEILRMCAQGVAARPDLPGEIGHIDQAAALVQKAQLEALTARVKEHASGSAELHEWVGLIESENARLCDARSQLEDKVADLEDQVISLDEELSRMRYRAQQAEQGAEELRDELANAQARLAFVDRFEQMPKTLPEVVDLLQKMFCGRVAFTEEAFASAAESSFDHIPSAWDALFALCRHLPDLLFGEDLTLRAALVKLNERTGLDASASEGEQTRADRKLMAQRHIAWEGKTYNIEPHVKVDRGRRSWLRIHFAPDFDRKCLVIGHCGDHLTTVGTRRGRGK